MRINSIKKRECCSSKKALRKQFNHFEQIRQKKRLPKQGAAALTFHGPWAPAPLIALVVESFRSWNVN